MEGSEQHRAVDACTGCARQIFGERRVGIPESGQPVAFPRMAMAVNDHGSILLAPCSGPAQRTTFQANPVGRLLRAALTTLAASERTAGVGSLRLRSPIFASRAELSRVAEDLMASLRTPASRSLSKAIKTPEAAGRVRRRTPPATARRTSDDVLLAASRSSSTAWSSSMRLASETALEASASSPLAMSFFRCGRICGPSLAAAA